MKFYLGTHQPAWLARDLGVPLLVSHRRLAGRRTLPRASGEWALDSGGFTELSLHGRWRTDARTYATAVGRYAAEIGQLAWAAPQDWMVEAHVRARTGLSLRTHLQRTVRNYLQLRELAPDLPIIPIVQGDQVADYLRCADSYERHGVDLAALPLVGVGSVCRRQHSGQVERIVRSLHARGLRLHCFGVKTIGLARYGEVIQSSDSAAWSFSGRYQPGCTPTHQSEANCLPYALAWHHRLQRTLNSPPRHDHTRPDTPRRCAPGPGRSQPGGARPSPHCTDTRVRAHRNRPAQRKAVRR
ncbi:hypothetical protein [Amycolatopsis sp. YIM 10]|uniref:deazapurine DNA modification protein DpdA family protein n=1 Tax=Amycolatopsis sp. YIM 10 TaxID=2653857 RepID=UPI0012A7D99C|nr:hypothetical protein [Amycolatopsis sp. YIM 10]QFU86764.1 hypothetical protein YIM_07765 [Amycolatopsis sp. YIM 10]